MTELSVTVTIPPGPGLHARPAAVFVDAAVRSGLTVTVGRPGQDPVAATSILSVMGLGVQAGEDVVLRALGDDAQQKLEALARVLANAEGALAHD